MMKEKVWTKRGSVLEAVHEIFTPQELVSRLPVKERLKGVPVPEILEHVPITKVLEHVPITRVLEHVPISDRVKDLSLLEIFQNAPEEEVEALRQYLLNTTESTSSSGNN